ncbi:hypothetical protein OC834_002087 [Tilletia horrida]|nr:hypothetical protein OC834_002087 [Tilletia horrida]
MPDRPAAAPALGTTATATAAPVPAPVRVRVPVPAGVPALPAKFASNPALYATLKQRCSLPASLAQRVRSLAADAQLATALRQREQAALARVVSHPAGAGEDEADEDVGRAHEGLEASDRPMPPASTPMPMPMPTQAYLDSTTPPNKRRKTRRGQQAASTVASALAGAAPGGATLPIHNNTSTSASPITTAASGGAGLAGFNASVPPAFRLLHSPSTLPSATSPPHVLYGESAILQPTQTSKLIQPAGTSSQTSEGNNLASSSAASSRSGSGSGSPSHLHSALPDTSDTDEPLLAADHIIVRLSIASLHPTGGRRRQTVGGAGPSSHEAAAGSTSRAHAQEADVLNGGDADARDADAAHHHAHSVVNQEVEVPASWPLARLAEAVVCPTRLLPHSTRSATLVEASSSRASAEQEPQAELDLVAVQDGPVFLPAGRPYEEREA